MRYSMDSITEWLSAGFIPKYDWGLNIIGWVLNLPECSFIYWHESVEVRAKPPQIASARRLCIVYWDDPNPIKTNASLGKNAIEMKKLLIAYHGSVFGAEGELKLELKLEPYYACSVSIARAGQGHSKAIAKLVQSVTGPNPIRYWGIRDGSTAWIEL